jgi:ABC-type multidrug transport system fused ATPase/permease subunit
MVATAHDNRNDETLGVPATRLMRVETNAYVENQKKAEFNRNLSQYMFWGATTLLGALALGVAGIGVTTALGLGSPLVIGGGVISAATFVASLFFSNRAIDIAERGNVLYSDIDSQNQAHRMVQAFAKAQTQGQVQADNSSPMTSSEPSFVERYGNRAEHSGNWQERVAAQAEREEAQTLAGVQQASRG